jgi:hypothetical protein
MSEKSKPLSLKLGVIKLSSKELENSMVRINGVWHQYQKSLHGVSKVKISLRKPIEDKLEKLVGFPVNITAVHLTASCPQNQFTGYGKCIHQRSITVRIDKNLFNPDEDRFFDVFTKCLQCSKSDKIISEKNLFMLDAFTGKNVEERLKNQQFLTPVKGNLKKTEPKSCSFESDGDLEIVQEDEDEPLQTPKPDETSRKRKLALQSESETPTQPGVKRVCTRSVWEDYENVFLSCATREIKKSIAKVKKSCQGKDRPECHIAILRESPYLAINFSKSITDLAFKMMEDIQAARRTLEASIEESMMRNMTQDLKSDEMDKISSTLKGRDSPR